MCDFVLISCCYLFYTQFIKYPNISIIKLLLFLCYVFFSAILTMFVVDAPCAMFDCIISNSLFNMSIVSFFQHSKTCFLGFWMSKTFLKQGDQVNHLNAQLSKKTIGSSCMVTHC